MPRFLTPLLACAAFAASFSFHGALSAQDPGTPPGKTGKVVEQAGKGDAKKTDAKKGEAKTGEGQSGDPKADPKKGEAGKPGEKGDAKTPKKELEEIKTKDADASEIEIPEGATEDDIRAIRGANAMLRTEKKLAGLLKKMKVPGNVPFVQFDSLDAWPYEDGYKGMPKELGKLDGKKVAMAGFMLPIDEVEDIKTFYLVKSLWSCCYGIPPDVNGLVKINVEAKKGVAYQWDPILIVGTFRLKKVMDEDYTICIWQIDDAQVRVIEVD